MHVYVLVEIFSQAFYGTESIAPSPMGFEKKGGDRGLNYLSERLVSIRGSDDEIHSGRDEDDSTIPFWRCPSPVAFAASGDDGCIDAAAHVRQARRLMERQ